MAADSTEYPKEFIEGFELSDEVLKELRGDEVESAATRTEILFLVLKHHKSPWKSISYL